ncbi:Anti-anti-sigma regulatory factor (antagonist of anti-sigma factor) [Salinihabitans flavidus]|uniref:Anti-anti-sigma regulatory factor (Antagonist of anti-sigma factor) n=1 Tax=Salinihabitans flavidus TaxID=569882 RepID=A0A1H8QJI4_9RHOB|nr:STAS domain-containing protein [Salinihabitans flavidus]SEO54400.1 Anti-anti-sigma regulatory factor (antagonist of anti-sigma factor) [Salinihabitans flavidus]
MRAIMEESALQQDIQPDPSEANGVLTTTDNAETDAGARTPVHMELPGELGFAAAEEVAEAFEHLRDSPVVVDASKVSHLGALALQVILSAFLQWRRDSCDFRITAMSAAFEEGLTLLGISDDLKQEMVKT